MSRGNSSTTARSILTFDGSFDRECPSLEPFFSFFRFFNFFEFYGNLKNFQKIFCRNFLSNPSYMVNFEVLNPNMRSVLRLEVTLIRYGRLKLEKLKLWDFISERFSVGFPSFFVYRRNTWRCVARWCAFISELSCCWELTGETWGFGTLVVDISLMFHLPPLAITSLTGRLLLPELREGSGFTTD